MEDSVVYQPNLIPTKSQFKELLSKSSEEVKRERKIEMVDFEEINKIIFQLESPGSYANAYKKIGLSTRSYNDDKQKGKSRLVTKYALLGLLAEQKQHTTHNFSPEELEILYTSLIILQQNMLASSSNVDRVIKNLKQIITNLLTKE